MNTSKKYIVSFVLSVFARTHAAEKHFNMIFSYQTRSLKFEIITLKQLEVCKRQAFKIQTQEIQIIKLMLEQ